MPTNIGVVDVGQIQKAYSGAMQNVKDATLFGKRLEQERAALDYQEALARQQTRLLTPQEQALAAQYGATQIGQENVGIAGLAQRPFVAPTAATQASAGLSAAQIEAALKGAQAGLAPAVGESKALAELYSSEADRKIAKQREEQGGLAVQNIPVGPNINVPVLVQPGGGGTPIGGTIAGQMLSKAVTGEYTTTTNITQDSAGNSFAERSRFQIHPNGSRTLLTKVVVPYTPNLQDEFVSYGPQGGIAPAPAAQPPSAPLTAAPAPATAAQPSRPLATFGGPMALGSVSAAAPQPRGSALAAPAAAPVPAPAPAAAPVPVEAPVAPAAAPNVVTIPWLRNREVSADSPLAQTEAAFDEAASKGGVRRAKPTPEFLDEANAYQQEATLAAQTLQTKADALARLAKSAQTIEKEGIGTGAWQQYVPADLLQLMGDASKQDFTSAVNELVNKLSEDTKFRNFAVVDLIRSTKPETSDDPSVVTAKIDYLAKGLTRWQDAALAANEGLSRGIAPMRVKQIITRNFTNIPYEKFARENPASPISRPQQTTTGTATAQPVVPTGRMLSFEEWRAAKAKGQ